MDNKENMIVNSITSIEKEKIKVEKTKDYYRVFIDLLNAEDDLLRSKEHSWIMGINWEGYVVCVYIVALGAENIVNVTAHDLFRTAINHEAKSIILAHNHPNENIPIQSEEDFKFTNRVYHMAELLDIVLHDHLIICSASLKSEEPVYYSFKEVGVIEAIKVDLSYKPYEDIKHILEEEKKEYGKDKEKKGSKEGKKKMAIDIAKKMLLKNMPIEEIAEITSLSEKEIKSIEKEVNPT